MRPNPSPSSSASTSAPITLILQPGQEVHIFVTDSNGTIPKARQDRFLAGIAPSPDGPRYSPSPSPDSPAYSPKPSPDKRVA